MKTYRISDLEASPKYTAKDIPNYSKLSEIFDLYMNDYYDTMTREIANYGRFEFFTDLIKFLIINLTNTHWREFFYSDILEEYTYRIVEFKLKNDGKHYKRRTS